MVIRRTTCIGLALVMLVAASAAALSSAACSGGDAHDAAALVKSAIDAVDDPSHPPESAHITVTLVEDITSPTGTGSLTMNVDGELDPPKAFRLDYTMTTGGVMQDALGSGMPVELVFEVISVDGGSTTFARFPAQGDRWLTGMPGMDMTRYFDFRASQKTTLSCADDIEYLRREDVGGVVCDVVRITPDFEELLAERSDLIEGFSTMVGEEVGGAWEELMSSATGTTTVWIGVDDQLPYRSVSDMTLSMADYELQVHSEETISDYGEPVEPPIVAPSDAIDVGDLPD